MEVRNLFLLKFGMRRPHEYKKETNIKLNDYYYILR